MRRHSPRPLAGALEQLTASLAPATPLARVLAVWDQAVGEQIAANARPTAERGGTLTVTCSASVWAQELEMMGETLAERLNSQLGEELVRELRCRTG